MEKNCSRPREMEGCSDGSKDSVTDVTAREEEEKVLTLYSESKDNR